ncbi:MAG: 30S ribosomal protein S7 [Saprospiraceae bacterium]|nr:30S ribosomal protein S7 [Saprospiraceae bacterium]
MRKRKPKVRIIAPDPRYGDQTVTRFVNNLMERGKKNLAYQLFYDAMDLIKERSEEDPLELFRQALINATPQVEVRSRRIGGATFQIPTEIPVNRRISIGMKWLIRFAKTRNGKGMADKLAAELQAASKGEGAAVKRKEDTHRMAESNRAFAHFRV